MKWEKRQSRKRQCQTAMPTRLIHKRRQALDMLPQEEEEEGGGEGQGQGRGQGQGEGEGEGEG
eukprot:7395403-Prorocentrum_lima.AAC.1